MPSCSVNSISAVQRKVTKASASCIPSTRTNSFGHGPRLVRHRLTLCDWRPLWRILQGSMVDWRTLCRTPGGPESVQPPAADHGDHLGTLRLTSASPLPCSAPLPCSTSSPSLASPMPPMAWSSIFDPSIERPVRAASSETASLVALERIAACTSPCTSAAGCVHLAIPLRAESLQSRQPSWLRRPRPSRRYRDGPC